MRATLRRECRAFSLLGMTIARVLQCCSRLTIQSNRDPSCAAEASATAGLRRSIAEDYVLNRKLGRSFNRVASRELTLLNADGVAWSWTRLGQANGRGGLQGTFRARRDSQARPLCLHCDAQVASGSAVHRTGTLISGEAASVTETDLDMFCSGRCREQFVVSHCANAARPRVERREKEGHPHGHIVCSHCGIDCTDLEERLASIASNDVTARRNVLLSGQPDLAHCVGLLDRLSAEASNECRRSLWQCDHIVPVHQGGGETADLANFQTLCVACHAAKTRLERLAPSRKRSR
mgnify:FL=1